VSSETHGPAPHAVESSSASAVPSSHQAANTLAIANLQTHFFTKAGVVKAVNGVSFGVSKGEVLGLVGESGSGKSVTGFSILGLVDPPGEVVGGSIRFQGRELVGLDEIAMREIRGSRIAMIFQDPMMTLNPVLRIDTQMIEAIQAHSRVSRAAAMARSREVLLNVGIASPDERLKSYPHQFSGGMRQRVAIAIALLNEPDLIIADEPTTALDVTIQSQILELLSKLQRDRDMAVMLITHDLGVVAENADVVCVMYAGRAVEYATVYDLFEKAYHPYTRGLFSSVPKMGEGKHRLTTIDEVINNPAEFRKLPGHDKGIVPWWPTMPPPADLAASPGGSDSPLHEIEPGHWVGCWRTEYLEHRPALRPDIAFRRHESK